MTFSMKKQNLFSPTLFYLEPYLGWVLQGFSQMRGCIQGYIFAIGTVMPWLKVILKKYRNHVTHPLSSAEFFFFS